MSVFRTNNILTDRITNSTSGTSSYTMLPHLHLILILIQIQYNSVFHPVHGYIRLLAFIHHSFICALDSHPFSKSSMLLPAIPFNILMVMHTFEPMKFCGNSIPKSRSNPDDSTGNQWLIGPRLTHLSALRFLRADPFSNFALWVNLNVRALAFTKQ